MASCLRPAAASEDGSHSRSRAVAAATAASNPRHVPGGGPPLEKTIPQIYTEWANHYLERGRYKRHISDLQEDVCDGVLLADVIEAVTGMTVGEIIRKPKAASQKIENIKGCLNLLGTMGVSLEGISAQDIRDGNLKTILNLFFNLSRFKQAQKANGHVIRTVPPPPPADAGTKSHTTQKLKPPGVNSNIPGPPNGIRRGPDKTIPVINRPSGLAPPSVGGGSRGVVSKPTLRPPKASGGDVPPHVSSRPSSTSSSSSIPHLPSSRPVSGADSQRSTMLDKVRGATATPGGMSRVESSSSLQSGDSRSTEGQERSRTGGPPRKVKPSSQRSGDKPLPLKPKPNLKSRNEGTSSESRTLPKTESRAAAYASKTAPDRSRYRAKISNIPPAQYPPGEEGGSGSGIPKPTATVRGTSKSGIGSGGTMTLPSSLNRSGDLASRLQGSQNKLSTRMSTEGLYAPSRGIALVTPMVAPVLNPITEGGGESPVSLWKRHRTPEDEEEEMLVKPMQPLTYGYARRLAKTLPSAAAAGVTTTAGVTTLDGGYLSDGDVLAWPRLDDPGSGYMSEGGASLYARTRAAVPINVLQDDSTNNRIPRKRKGLDDSSSLSSGISDTLADFSTDDNLTGSSSDYARSHRSRYRYGPPGQTTGGPSQRRAAALPQTGSSVGRRSLPGAPRATTAKVKVCANTQTYTQELARLSYESQASSDKQEPAQEDKSLARVSSLSEETPAAPSLSRSDSIRSTKSEQVYPSMLQRSDDTQERGGGQEGRHQHHQGRGSTHLPPQLSKEDEVHGSALSLGSSASSIYSGCVEEKQSQEIRRLRKELGAAHDKIATLTAQLATNAHVVAAFEQSLSNMTTRLQHLTATAEKKDSEVHELRSTIEALKQQSAEAGLTKVALQSMQAVHKSLQQQRMSRQLSTDSVSSVNSVSSGKSGESGGDSSASSKQKKKKKSWLRSSFSKAFAKSKKNKHGSVSDVEELSVPNSPMLNHHPPSMGGPRAESPTVELRRQLREKDLLLTDIRLEALSSQHQLDTLKEQLARLRVEVSSLRRENERLRRQLAESANQGTNPDEGMMSEPETVPNDEPSAGLKIKLQVVQGQSTFYIGCLRLSPDMDWSKLDAAIGAVFKDYLSRIDPVSSLGLAKDSIAHCQIGEHVFKPKDSYPAKTPGEIIDEKITHISLSLKGLESGSADGLAFETLIPRPILERYLSQLGEHRRVILCGPSGTGKTFLAQKLAHHLVLKQGGDPEGGAVTTFSVDHKSAKELRQFLSSLAERCRDGAHPLPSVVILDNLHHVGGLAEVFNGFLGANHHTCPYIIGTMNQASSAATNLQLHHNFRWVLCANHVEPVLGFLGRFLRRRLLEEGSQGGELMAHVVDWIPRVWRHLNHFLEAHSSSDVTIGPRLFLSCPVDSAAGSQVWFTDVWNYSVVPYLVEAVREGLQLYGRRAPWEDPAEWVLHTYPWPTPQPPLLRLRPEDVGYEGHPALPKPPDNDADPLLNMLMRLQEAASYSSPQSELPSEDPPPPALCPGL